MDIEEYLSQPVDLKSLVDELQFNADDVEAAALRQPKLFLEASRYRVKKMRKKARRLIKVELIEADVAHRLRRASRNAERGEKMTESAISDAVKLDPKWKKEKLKLERAFEEEEFAKQLLETYRHRQSTIKVVADIRNAEMSNELRQVKQNMALEGQRKLAERARKRVQRMEED